MNKISYNKIYSNLIFNTYHIEISDKKAIEWWSIDNSLLFNVTLYSTEN
jgi:hypothetical protein